MNNLEKYMNDPAIINEPLPMREVHAIRLMLRDQTKNMTPEEHTRHVNEQARKLIAEYGLKINLHDRPAI